MSGDVEALADVLRRIENAEDAWLWHEQTDELLAGYGHHMSQMLYRLPRDGQTDDMKASVEQMLADLRRLAAYVAAERECPACGADSRFCCLYDPDVLAAVRGRAVAEALSAYEAKVQDFAIETWVTSKAHEWATTKDRTWNGDLADIGVDRGRWIAKKELLDVLRAARENAPAAALRAALPAESTRSARHYIPDGPNGETTGCDCPIGEDHGTERYPE